jgi:probable rRNA maturation factor
MAVRVRINFELPRARRAPVGRREARALFERAIRMALEAHSVKGGEVSLTLLDDEAIAAINEQYLAHEGPTDVITFALHGEGEPPLGDIYVGWEQALRQAADFGVSPREELARLAVHGTLHVLGYDHPEGPERERSSMWIRQEQILREVMGT